MVIAVSYMYELLSANDGESFMMENWIFHSKICGDVTIPFRVLDLNVIPKFKLSINIFVNLVSDAAKNSVVLVSKLYKLPKGSSLSAVLFITLSAK